MTNCLLDILYSGSVWFLFPLSVTLPAHHACHPWVCRNAHLPGQSETCSLPSFQAFSVQCWFKFRAGAHQHSLLLPPHSFLWEQCRPLLLGRLETSLCWCYVQIEVASGGFTQCLSLFPGGNESSERRVINLIGR